MSQNRAMILIALSLLAGVAVDIVLSPTRNLAVIFLIPVMIAALWTPPSTVIVTSVVVVILDAIDVHEAHTPPDVWIISLTTLLALCAMAIILSMREEEIARRAREQEALASAATALVRSPSLKQAGEAIAEQTVRVLNVAAVLLWEGDRERREWRLIAARGLALEQTSPFQLIPFDQAIEFAEVARTQRPLEIRDVTHRDPNSSSAWQFARITDMSSAFIQPLLVEGDVVGIVLYLRKASHDFGSERRLIDPLGSLWAIAVENARLHDTAIRRAGEAEEAREHLQRFLVMVAHELRGPLTSILGYAQLLSRVRTGAEVDIQGLRTIESAARRVSRLTADLLDAGRIGAGTFTIRPRPTDLAALVREVAETQRTTAPGRTIVVETDDRIVGNWDDERIVQLVSNLTSNALKYSPPQAPVVLRAYRQGDEAIVDVTDHGVGVSPEQIQRLFQPFSRLDQTASIQGVGLGLYIAQGIVEAHGGRIQVESTPGEGSRFMIALPLDDPASPAGETPPGSAESPGEATDSAAGSPR